MVAPVDLPSERALMHRVLFAAGLVLGALVAVALLRSAGFESKQLAVAFGNRS